MKQDISRSIRWGLLFYFIQLALVLLVAPRFQGLESVYMRLNQWDSWHYLDIVNRGYQLPPGLLTANDVHSNRANVGYFPAYPLIVQAFQSIVPVSSSLGLLLVAQFFCVLFWTQFFLLLRFLGLRWQTCFRWGITIFVYPASFFLIAGYSESLFLAALLGFILWTEVALKRTKSILSWGLAALCGVLLSSSRLVGIPLVIYPLFRVFFSKSQPQRRITQVKAIGLAGVSGMGGLAFFIWTYFRFGQWDLYLKLQKLGWGNEPDYGALFYPTSYFPKLFFEDTTTSVCKASNLFILGLFLGLLIRCRKKVDWSLFLISFSMFFISLSGKASYSMDSMVRYNLPVFVIWIVAWIKSTDSGRWCQSSFQGRRQNGFLWLGYLIALAFQIWMIRVFTKGGWVA
jgi:hypothetical protein